MVNECYLESATVCSKFTTFSVIDSGTDIPKEKQNLLQKVSQIDTPATQKRSIVDHDYQSARG